MKNQIKWTLLLLSLSLMFGSANKRFDILSSQSDKVTISFNNEEINQKEEAGFVRLKTSTNSTIDHGLPELPKFVLSYGVNPNKEYAVSYNVISSHQIDNINILPYQEVKKNLDSNDNTIYINTDYNESNDFYPQSVISEKRMIMRGKEILSIDLVPFEYNLSTKNLTVYDEIEITIEETSNRNVLSTQLSKQSETFNNMYNNIVLGTFDNREIDFQNPSILYICGGNSLEYTYMDLLIDWRKRQGYDVTAVNLTEVGGNSTTYIKNYIENAYYTWENPPEFICLVGDASGSGSVPTVPTYTNIGGGSGWSGAYAEGDLPYVLLEGDDFIADATIGRISVRSENEFSVVASKIIGYEKLYAGTDWIENVALVGDPYDSGISTVITNEYIAMIMEDYGVENINEQYSGSNTFDDFMRDQLNSGVSFLNYRGFYGFSGFDSNDVNQLTNGFKLPFLTTLTCDTGSFYTMTSAISETLLRAGTSVNNPRGAVAVVATAQPYTHTAFNNIVTMGMYSGIFLYGAKTAGESLAYGELALGLAYPQNPNNNVYYFSAWNNLMGDPATMLWTDTPRILIADHVSSVSLSDDFIDIHIIDQDGNPVEGANVNLSPRNSGIFTNQRTDMNGHAYVPIDEAFSGNIVDVTVTCHDCYYVESSFSVTSSSLLPELNSASVIIDDNTDLNSNNNEDGLINPGESISLSFYMFNNTGDNLSNLNVSVKSSDLSISSDDFNISQLDSGGGIYVENLVINLPADILPDTEPIFFVNTSDNQNESNQYLDLDVFSGATSLRMNENIDPGTTLDVTINLTNIGDISFNQLYGEILYQGNDLSFSNSNLLWGSTNPGSDSYSNELSISAMSDIINGSIFNIPVRISSDYAYEQIVNMSFTVGQVSVSDPLGPDAYGYYIYDELDIDYDLAPTYSWVEIAPPLGGDGYQLDINDNGNNQDESTVIDLPFEFTFYGVDYNEVTVCSNGWIGFGSLDLESFRNYPIPGTGGPSPMVAVFWDDLEDGDVYALYDESNDRFIIEWYNFDTYLENSNEEFQIILYNTGNQTPTGDDEMLLQYRDFNNTSVGEYPVGNYNGAVVHGQYTSVGLEDHTGLVGLEYTFNNQYPTAAATLSDNSALFITTRSSSLYAQPMVDISNSEFEITIAGDETSSEILSITNSGESESYLTYELEVSPFANPQGNIDDFGYGWSTSDDDDYIDYNWIDISNDNETLEFVSNDLSPGYFSLNFDFPFYGEQYSQILINPNGWIGFGEDNDEWDNQGIYDDGSPTNAILGYWDDLNPVSADNEEGAGYVRYHSDDERMVVWYDNVRHWTSSQIIFDFQIVLFSSGEIKVNFREMQGISDDGGTIGIINSDGSIGQQVGFGDSEIENSLSVLFKTSPNWLSLNQFSGSLLAGESDDVILDINMENYSDGDYVAYISLSTNASEDIIIPFSVSYSAADFMMGDLNSDGGVDILDVVRLVSIILNGDGTGYELSVSDLNSDNDVNIMDCILLVQIILSL
tara:strand:- start:651 stop:5150 length:4500 start_codon:yes stop_codon:yes gene_type:complete